LEAGPKYVRLAISHETGHYINDIAWENNEVGGVPQGRWLDNSNYHLGDGLQGYHYSIEEFWKISNFEKCFN
jgi:hypothetical protein